MLQAPAGSFPALVKADDVPSVTPSHPFQNGTLRSGDILVSRGGAPTSALIARGNDYPGNFSHVALFHVDEKTGETGIVESHIEMGVVVSTVEQYIRDKKLRILVLRLRPDLPQMKADPMLPHRAAKMPMTRSSAAHPLTTSRWHTGSVPWFCSEVASWAYRECCVELWKGTTRMSAPGGREVASYFGVTHFETQAPPTSSTTRSSPLLPSGGTRDPLAGHVDNAVVEAMWRRGRGGHDPAPWWKLAAVEAGKAYSVVLNGFGVVGPVPRGWMPRRPCAISNSPRGTKPCAMPFTYERRRSGRRRAQTAYWERFAGQRGQKGRERAIRGRPTAACRPANRS